MEKLKFLILQSCAVGLYIHMLANQQPISTEYNLAWINFVIQVVVMIALAMVMAPKPKQPKKPIPIGIEQFDVPTAEEGRAVQVLFGKRFVSSPNVVWYGHLRSTPVMG